jgi:hypothetical protein
MKITIKVTQDNINKGKRKALKKCPLALAFEEAGYKSPVVWYWSTSFKLPGSKDTQYVSLSNKAKNFIEKFDAADTADKKSKIKPQTFTFSTKL